MIVGTSLALSKFDDSSNAFESQNAAVNSIAGFCRRSMDLQKK